MAAQEFEHICNENGCCLIPKVKMTKLTDEQLDNKMNFIYSYLMSNNAADGSFFDPNSNVTQKNIATLSAELNKDINIQINRRIIWEKLNNLFNEEIANKYIEQLEKHEIYCHDETHALMPYCAAVSLYPFLENGLQAFGGEAKAPKHLSSFNGGFLNLIFALSSQFAGAVATPSFLPVFDAMARYDIGRKYLENYPRLIEQELQQVIYALNQPASARNSQCPFWNISIFDKYYFDALFGNVMLPNGLEFDWESTNKLQKFFLTWFNRERTKAVLTFPVITVSMLTEGNDIKDKEYKQYIAKELSEGNSFFIYTSPTVDSLSSCCFEGKQKVIIKKDNKVIIDTLKNLHRKEGDAYVQVLSKGKWCEGKFVIAPKSNLYKIIVSNNKYIVTTKDHIHCVLGGNKQTSELTTEDYLEFNLNTLNGDREYDEYFTVSDGYIIGSFLGSGVFGSTMSNGCTYETIFYSSQDVYQTLVRHLRKLTGDNTPIRVSDDFAVTILHRGIADFIKRWVKQLGETNNAGYTFNIDCLLQSKAFRHGILAGWNDASGCCSIYKELVEDMEVLTVSLGGVAKIETSDKSFEGNNSIYSLKLYDVRENTNKRGVYKVFNNKAYFKIEKIIELPFTARTNNNVYCIEMKDINNPYFTLPNGINTHNCRLRNSITDQLNDFSYSLGAGGISTGSINVITLNLNRFIQNILPNGKDVAWQNRLRLELVNQIDLIHKYQYAFRKLFEELQKAKMLPAYDAGYITLSKQYVTIGLNGVVEAAEYLGFKPNNNYEYLDFIAFIFNIISERNRKASKEYNMKINTELVPAESLGVKFSRWDKKDNYEVPRECYNSYLYPVEDINISPIDKFIMHGKNTIQYLDGGSALHLNLEEYPTEEAYSKLLEVAAKSGCNYFCTNVKVTICNDCGYIDKHTLNNCSKCNSTNVDYATRTIGYLRRISNFSKERQEEEARRYYHKI